jgi:hypothetical protein
MAFDSTYLLALVPFIAATLLVRRLEARRQGLVNFPFICLATVLALFLLVVGDLMKASLLALGLVAAIGAASKTKFAHLQMTLAASDFRLLVINGRFLRQQYRRELMIGAVIVALGLAALGATLAYAPATPVPLYARIALAIVGAIAFAVEHVKAVRAPERHQIEGWHDANHVSNFVRTLLGTRSAPQRLEFHDIAREGLACRLARPAAITRDSPLPDVILILHESTFDPAIYGLPVDAEVRAFLSPEPAITGALAVDVFGGGTVQSEFSVLTGLSTLAFGHAGRFVMPLAHGRVHRALPAYLKALGYRSTVLAAAHTTDPHGDRFYAAMGFDARFYLDTMMPGFDAARWRATRADEQIYEAALYRHREVRGTTPSFMAINTLMNHGPHRRRLPGLETHRRAREIAMGASGNARYAEYYARLAASAAAYASFRDALDRMPRRRPTIIIRYGDHQPRLGLPQSRTARARRTFYAIEASGFDLDAGIVRPDPLDSAFLATIALQAAGLPLDGFYAAHADLVAECGSAYDATASERKRRFHRSLLDEKLFTPHSIIEQRHDQHLRAEQHLRQDSARRDSVHARL